MFRATAVQPTLPMGVESYEAWKTSVLDRLKAHFEQEAEAADSVRAFFGASARKGLALFDLLARRYDIVAANPPYMGSGNQGDLLRAYLATHFPAGKLDLYSAFIENMVRVLHPSGRWAAVSPRSWMTLGTFEPFRVAVNTRAPIELAADLGPGAFEEISGEVVSVVLSIGRGLERTRERAIRFIDVRMEEEKGEALRAGLGDHFSRTLTMIERIPGQRFAYRLTPDQIDLFTVLPPLRARCFMTIGLFTGSNERFVRNIHEVKIGDRWRGYLKTQSPTRWAGEVFEAIDWELNGARIRARYSEIGASGGKYNGEEYYGIAGVSATRVGGGQLRAQLFPDGLLFDSAASCGFAESPELLALCCAYLNSEICQHFARELNGSFNYQAGDLNLLPFPDAVTEEHRSLISHVGDAAAMVSLDLKQTLTDLRFTPAAREGQNRRIGDLLRPRREERQERATALKEIERRINGEVPRMLGLSNFGCEVAPIVNVSTSNSGDLEPLFDIVTESILRLLGHRWPKQIEAGELPPDWADRDGVIPMSTDSTETTLTERVLDRLGREFPGGDHATIRAEFEEIVDTSLEAWLAGGFFARHISQFKKRPIAWQLQSQPAAQPSRRRSAPARGPLFACLVYYHCLDADLLPKLRSHYLGGLRSAHETELRTLEALMQPTTEQVARKAELEMLLDELNRFDAQLQSVTESGFGPASLQPRLRQLTLDDGILALKARWLARLRDTLQTAPAGLLPSKSPLAEWQAAATALGHHADFHRWIADAIAHLPRHCAKAGAKSPDAAKFSEDPTATMLAAVICAATDAMAATALDRLCAEWEHEWDTHVIEPLRARIFAATSALDQLIAELETLDRPTARVEEIAREQKRLRAEVKTFRREIKDDRAGRSAC
ncbi:MAG TPA: hypothetical protein VKG79_16730, partial [Bryobacteraceae bacterium]|nr:hypothetical protein [Bryobacteraceae bacterium]